MFELCTLANKMAEIFQIVGNKYKIVAVGVFAVAFDNCVLE